MADVLALKTWGFGQVEIAERLGVNQASVSRALRKAEERGIRPARIRGEQLGIQWFGEEERVSMNTHTDPARQYASTLPERVLTHAEEIALGQRIARARRKKDDAALKAALNELVEASLWLSCSSPGATSGPGATSWT